VKIEISIDCIDDTGRIPKGQVIVWDVPSSAFGGDVSRDRRMRAIAKDIVGTLRQKCPRATKRNASN
jgi:hypothetical protein